jgi:tRNA threonylcarbamoyladenosine biosynthesis protein TsaE
MKDGTLISGSQRETEEIGRELGESLTPGAVVLLYGVLGAGKTAFARGLAEGLGVADTSVVHSPTFSLVNEYPCPLGIVCHVDLYRLETLQDFYSIGLDELLESEAIIVVEWAEKLRFQVDHPLRVNITVAEDETRLICISGTKTNLE